MGRNGFISSLFVFLLINDVSGIEFDLNIRKLAALGPPNNSASTQVPGAEKPDSPTNVKSSRNSSKDVANNPPIPDTAPPNHTAPLTPKASADTMNDKTNGKRTDNRTESSPPQGEESKKKPSTPQGEDTTKNPSPPRGKKDDNKFSPPKVDAREKTNPPPKPKETDKKRSPPPEAKKIDKKLSPPRGDDENCDGVAKKCQVQDKFTGCVRNLNPDSKELEILVQNDGQEDLTVSLIIPTSAKDDKPDIPVPQHQTIKVNISNIMGRALKIVLKTGNSECGIVIGSPLPEGTVIFRLPATEKLFTPINGAYFLLVTVVTIGGIWACCKFTKRRRHGSVPYQEIEMALPETASAPVETAEGWDQGWDDDWDEENSVKSPVIRLHTGNISANGLTSRPANRDGWEND